MDQVYEFAEGYRRMEKDYVDSHNDGVKPTSFELGPYLHAYMVREELGVELREAVRAKSLQGTLDALIDSIYFCSCGLYQKFTREQVSDAWRARLTAVAKGKRPDWIFTGRMFYDIRALNMAYARRVDPDILVDHILLKPDMRLDTLENAVEGLYFVVLELDRLGLDPGLAHKAFDLVHENNMKKLTTGSMQVRDGSLKLVKPKTHVSADAAVRDLLKSHGAKWEHSFMLLPARADA